MHHSQTTRQSIAGSKKSAAVSKSNNDHLHHHQARTKSQSQYNQSSAPGRRLQLPATSSSVFGAGPVYYTTSSKNSKQVYPTIDDWRHYDDTISDDDDVVTIEEQRSNNNRPSSCYGRAGDHHQNMVPGYWKDHRRQNDNEQFRRNRTVSKSFQPPSPPPTLPACGFTVEDDAPRLGGLIKIIVPRCVDDESYDTPPERLKNNKSQFGVRFRSPLLAEPLLTNHHHQQVGQNIDEEKTKRKPSIILTDRSNNDSPSSKDNKSEHQQVVPSNERDALPETCQPQPRAVSMFSRPSSRHREEAIRNAESLFIMRKRQQRTEHKPDGGVKGPHPPEPTEIIAGDEDGEDLGSNSIKASTSDNNGVIRIAESESVIRIVVPPNRQASSPPPPQQPQKVVAVAAASGPNLQASSKQKPKTIRDSATSTHDLLPAPAARADCGTNTSHFLNNNSNFGSETNKVATSTSMMGSPDDGMGSACCYHYKQTNNEPSDFEASGLSSFFTASPNPPVNSALISVFGNRSDDNNGNSRSRRRGSSVFSQIREELEQENGVIDDSDDDDCDCCDDKQATNCSKLAVTNSPDDAIFSDLDYAAVRLPAAIPHKQQSPQNNNVGLQMNQGDQNNVKKSSSPPTYVCGRPFRGGICGRIFKTKQEWKKHEEVHLDPGAVACPPCWCVSTSPQWIARHLKDGCPSTAGQPAPPPGSPDDDVHRQQQQHLLQLLPPDSEVALRRSPRLAAKQPTPLK